MVTSDIADRIRTVAEGSRESVPYCMRELADLASWLVPDCHGATMALWRDGEADLTVASHPYLAVIADTDRRHEGPIHDSVARGSGVSVADLAAETRWPRYRATALAGGIRAVLVTVEPMRSAQLSLGVYSVSAGAFGPPVDAAHAMLVAQMAAGVRNAVEYDESRRSSTRSRQALDSRVAIERAKGVLMTHEDRDEEAAFRRLREIASRDRRKVADVALELLDLGYDDWYANRTQRPQSRAGS